MEDNQKVAMLSKENKKLKCSIFEHSTLLERLKVDNLILKKDMEYLLSLDTMKHMGKKILGLREAIRSFTRSTNRKNKIITRQSTRIVDLLADLEIIKETKCGNSYGSFPFRQDIHCGQCRYTIRCAHKQGEAERKWKLSGKGETIAED